MLLNCYACLICEERTCLISDNVMKHELCGFLNSNGGFLFIGVNDNKNIQGLGSDYNLSNRKDPKNFFQLEFDSMLKHFLSFSIKSNIVGQFYEIEGKEIFIVTVSPSKNRLVFLNGKEFYIRGEASTRLLTDIEEIAKYCIDKWGTNK